MIGVIVRQWSYVQNEVGYGSTLDPSWLDINESTLHATTQSRLPLPVLIKLDPCQIYLHTKSAS